MSTLKEVPNPQAFPLDEETWVNRGMTLLDYFAGQFANRFAPLSGSMASYEHVASESYKMSAAMLIEREKWIGQFGEDGRS